MTMDKSLRIRSAWPAPAAYSRRGERIAKLQEADRWSDGRSPLGLPKVRVLKLSMKKKKKKPRKRGPKAKPLPRPGAAALARPLEARLRRRQRPPESAPAVAK